MKQNLKITEKNELLIVLSKCTYKNVSKDQKFSDLENLFF